MIRPHDVLLYAGGECMQRYGVPRFGMTRRQRRNLLTFTRTGTAATLVGPDGRLRGTTADRLRFSWEDDDGDGEVDTLGMFAEAPRTNAVSAALTSWAITGGATWTGTTKGPDGNATSGKGIAHGSGGAEFRASNVPTGTPTNNTYQALSIYAKAGDASWACIRVNPKDANLKTAYFNLATGALGTIASGLTARVTGPHPDGWWRLHVAFDVLSGGSTAQWEVAPADGDGDMSMAAAGAPYVYFFDPQWEMDANNWTSPILAAGGVRGAEPIVVPWRTAPTVACAGMIRFRELDLPNFNSQVVWHIGASDGSNPYVRIRKVVGGNTYEITHLNNTTPVGDSAVINTTWLDLVDLFWWFWDDGSVRIDARKKSPGGSWSAIAAGTRSAEAAPETEWSAGELHLGSLGSTARGSQSCHRLLWVRGSGWTATDLLGAFV